MSAIDTTKGFKFRYRLSGQPPTILKLKFKDTETLTKHDLLNLESGEVDLGATNDTTFIGAAQTTAAGTDSTTDMYVISDWDAVYGVYDPNARLAGDTLDISGATGAMTVAASSNVDLIVVAPSAADEETLVMIAHGEHYQQP
jgi:hypothetical protein